MKDYRVGFGFDVHRFGSKKKDLILGGVKIPHSRGLLAVSDGDVLLHAICDALCGAAQLGDIGDHFPPAAPQSRGIDSKRIAEKILNKLGKKHKIINMDITVILEEPRLAPFKEKITRSLQKIFSVTKTNLKIKSKEGLNIFGGRYAIACFATVSVKGK